METHAASSPPTAADVLGELRDVFSAMDGNNDEEDNESDALSADGPDEVVARDAAAANRWPDGGEAAHPVRRPPEPAVLFPPGGAQPGAPRPESNIDDDAASYRSFGTTGGTDGGRSSSPPPDERLPRPSAPATVGDASWPPWHNSVGPTTQGINTAGTLRPPGTATYPDLGPPHPLLQAQMGYVGGPDPRLLLQQPDLHAYMVRPFPEFFNRQQIKWRTRNLKWGTRNRTVSLVV